MLNRLAAIVKSTQDGHTCVRFGGCAEEETDPLTRESCLVISVTKGCFVGYIVGRKPRSKNGSLSI
jgi:hypothetical protein